MSPIIPEEVQKLRQMMTKSEREQHTEVLCRYVDTLTDDELDVLVRLLEWG